jgi:thiamine pyrophosphate-dependent acetolactate synthase large subunit-like protein
MQRVDAVRALATVITKDDLIVSASGYLQHDWWNHRPGRVDNTFTSGTLGSVSPTALGLALALPDRRVISFDADGSVLMNLGVLCTLANESPPNLTVFVFDNGLYESAGAQDTHTGRKSDIAKMAAAAGCPNTGTVETEADVEREAARLLDDGEFGLLVLKIERGVTRWAPEQRKPTDGVEDKYRFIRYVEALEGIVIRARQPER